MDAGTAKCQTRIVRPVPKATPRVVIDRSIRGHQSADLDRSVLGNRDHDPGWGSCLPGYPRAEEQHNHFECRTHSQPSCWRSASERLRPWLAPELAQAI